jgi:hypothetical protein
MCLPVARRTGDRRIFAEIVDGGWRRSSLEPLTSGVSITRGRRRAEADVQLDDAEALVALACSGDRRPRRNGPPNSSGVWLCSSEVTQHCARR